LFAAHRIAWALHEAETREITFFGSGCRIFFSGRPIRRISRKKLDVGIFCLRAFWIRLQGFGTRLKNVELKAKGNRGISVGKSQAFVVTPYYNSGVFEPNKVLRNEHGWFPGSV